MNTNLCMRCEDEMRKGSLHDVWLLYYREGVQYIYGLYFYHC